MLTTPQGEPSMIVGHYAPAYALRARYDDVPLWVLCLAVQAPDAALYLLLPLGVEHMRIIPGMLGPLSMDLQSIAYTHSLVAVLAVGGLSVLAGWLAGRRRAGLIVGLAVASHWVADWLVHGPDLPLAPGASAKVGLGLWRLPVVGYAVEVGLLAAAFVWFRRRLPAGRGRVWADIACVGLVGVQTLDTFIVLPPTSPLAFAVIAEILYLVTILLALPVDRALARSRAGPRSPVRSRRGRLARRRVGGQ
jgi:hypothetical protein